MPNANLSVNNGLHLPLEPLLMMLRRRGFIIKPDDYIEVLRIIEQFGSSDIDKTAEWLCPVVATNEHEQNIFYQVIDEYKILQRTLTVPEEKKPVNILRKYWWVHLIILAIISYFLLQPAKPSCDIEATMPPLLPAYAIGDTLQLDASHIFYGCKADTLLADISWKVNNEPRLIGLHQRYVVTEPGPIQITLEIQSTQLQITRPRDSITVYGCNYLPAFTLEPSNRTIKAGEPTRIVAKSVKDASAITRYSWQVADSNWFTDSKTPFVDVRFDSAGTYRITANAQAGNDVSNCATQAETEIEVYDPEQNLQLAIENSGSVLQAPEPKMKAMWHWLLLAPAIFGIAILDRLRRRSADAQKNKVSNEPDTKQNPLQPTSQLKPIFEVPFEQRDTKLITDEGALRKVYNQMRQRTEEDGSMLNIGETVKAIIHGGGAPDLIFTPRIGQKEYLVAIDRSNPKSMMTAFFEWVARSMQEANIPVIIFYYDQQLKFYHKNHPLGISLQRLGALYNRTTLLFMGQAHQLVYQAYPVVDPAIIETLQLWDHKAILTPVPYPDWGIKEKTLGEHFIIIPADMDGLDYIVPAIYEKTRHAERFLQAKQNQWTSLEDWDFKDIVQLKAYLNDDPELFQWLCAICLYPKLRWEVIIEMGNTILDTYHNTDKLCYKNILAICRIPWVGEGTFPQRTRLLLLKELLPEKEVAARKTLVKMLQRATLQYGDGYYFNHEQKMQQVTSEFVLFAHDPVTFSGFEKSGQQFVQSWQQDLVTDAPLKKYLGPQNNSNWSTPLTHPDRAKGMEGWMDNAAKQKNRIVIPRDWKFYMESLLGWVLVLWVLLFFKAFPVESKAFSHFYDKSPDKNVMINMSVTWDTGCLVTGQPDVALISGIDTFPITPGSTKPDTGIVKSLSGIIQTNYRAATSAENVISITWMDGKKIAKVLSITNDSIRVSVSCTQDTVSPQPIPVLPSSKLPTYLDEFWTSRSQRIAIDLTERKVYLQTVGGRGIQTINIDKEYLHSPSNYIIVGTDETDALKRLSLSTRNAAAFSLAICPQNYTDETRAASDTSLCPNGESSRLYYPAEQNKIFVPRNAKSWVTSERNKITEIDRTYENISGDYRQQSGQKLVTTIQQLEHNVYLNTFYHKTASERQNAFSMVRANWPVKKSGTNYTWNMRTFKGGPFDRNYVQVVQKVTPVGTGEQNSQVKPATQNELLTALKYATGEIGDTKSGYNEKSLSQYLATIRGANEKNWGTAFVYWCYQRAGIARLLTATTDVNQMWNAIPDELKIPPRDIRNYPTSMMPGNLFFIYQPNSGSGSIGIITSVSGSTFETIEGTPGQGVIRRTRSISEINTGISNFAGVVERPKAAK